ncbi:MAG: hypothetical protein F4056_06995 [Chloroflexi bacterium]|nr:hypothetical protein [Gammaproteobacteria bacterium]MYH47324.1 hypothetical protein [Gammaproteobacteria bacterium]MYI83033.1 hypothetical protein [Chloroflexota bacterium]MYL12942.1 hypothetical protein [Gammaproteobacteria bacterium]
MPAARSNFFHGKLGVVMQARDILDETHKLEESGMERSWAEAVAKTIAKAVEPLATTADLEAESKARRKDFETLRAELKSESNALRKDLKEAINEKSDANIALLREEMKSTILSLKVWLLVILLGMWGSLSALILYTQ